MSLNSLLAQLRRDRKGFGAMELALAMPFLILLGLGTVDASKLISTKIDFEQAAQRGTDFALAKRPNGSDGSYIQAEVASMAGIDAQDVTVTIFLECNGVKQANFATVCAAGQSPARFVSVEVRKDVATEFDWSFFGRMFDIKAFDSTVSVAGDSLVRFQ